MTRRRVLGIPVDAVRETDIHAAIREHLTQGNGTLHIATLNPEYVMTARAHPAFADALERCQLITADGVGITAAMKVLHPTAPIDRVTGVALSWHLAGLSAETGEGMFLLGAGPGIADAAADEMRRRYPEARIVGAWADGSYRERDDAESIRRIAASGATILLVAYGAPNQVYWIERNLPELERIGVRVVIGIGGALDYISGSTPYAPPLVRRLGMEWAHRLIREPWRWRRQLVLPLFALLVVRDRIRTLFVRERDGIA